jgi:hypothetical protein
MTTEKDNYLFYYHLPIDRMQQIMGFCWRSIWNGYSYDGDLNLYLNAPTEQIKDDLFNILKILPLDLELGYSKFKREKPTKGEYGFTIEQLESFINESTPIKFAARTLPELIAHLANNEHAPELIRDASKDYLLSAQ